MKAILKTYQTAEAPEIAGHLEILKEVDGKLREWGQVPNSSGFWRTEDKGAALTRAKFYFPDIEIVEHKHTKLN